MQYYGAKWWKFDFHTHTPISIDYGKGPEQILLKARTPREWLMDHMTKEIDCVAVTDHNSGEWVDTLKHELICMREEQVIGFREIVIFPGVEITVHGNIHLLAIFDPSESSTHISNLLSRSGYNGTLGDSDDCTEKSFNEVVDIIHNMKGLAIPAHVDIVRGLFHEQEGNSLKKCLSVDGLLAIQVCDLNYQKPQIYIDTKINLSEIAGSDSHCPAHVGSSFTWVKMEYPNLEALRLALHDGEDGVIHSQKGIVNPNDLQQRFFIQSIEVIHGSKAGRSQPLKVNFSPWLNTVIGGRGSGKSSIIEYMRLPLNKITGLPNKVNEEFKEFNQVPKERGKTGMLTANTRIRIEMQKDGRSIALTWHNNNIIEEHRDDSGEWVQKYESSNIDARFPIRIFSQKHLYSLTEDPNHILSIVDQQFNKSAWLEKKEELTQQFLQARNKQRELTSKISTKGNLKSELDDVLAKMKIFEDSGHKQLLEEYQQTQSLNEKIKLELTKVDKSIKAIEVALNDISEEIFISEDFQALGNDLSPLLIKANDYKKLVSQIKIDLANLKELKITLTQTSETIPWQASRIEQEEKYNQFVKRLEESGEKNPNAYRLLVLRQGELKEKIDEIAKIEEQLGLQNEEIKAIYNNIELHEKNLRADRELAIKKWQGANQNIRIHLSIMGNSNNAEQQFRSIIRKSGTEFTKDILERDDEGNSIGGLVYELHKSDKPWEKRRQIITNVVSVSDQDNKGFGKPFVKHLLGQISTTPEDTDRMFLWYPEDKIILKLVDNRKEEDIETGSAGQRTAAMLSLMLLLDDSPIVIDQPEEDLDTKRITDLVVTSLRQFKKKQQVIVITHNPNIPVNGAAENIIQMNFAGGQIQKQISGALQKNDIREAVCEVMEGGKDALDKRYYRISRALKR
ncbi:TrlF family AAA-like ATPase [Paenibacillus sp. FSL H8-0332]|uniref:TrlF family AAA-like ATPase n=1 Tax=Paenibacillus sp. FSL H8-0332 TaxID=2954742 RepID=UPI0030CA6B00